MSLPLFYRVCSHLMRLFSFLFLPLLVTFSMAHLLDTTQQPKLKLLKNQMRGHKAYLTRLCNKVVPLLEAEEVLDDIHTTELESDLEYIKDRVSIMEEHFNMCLCNPEFPEAHINDYTDYVLGVKRVIKRGLIKCKKDVSTSSARPNDGGAGLNSTANESMITRQLLAHAKLPTVDVPLFHGGDGCWREYRSFLEMFNSLVDSDPDLTDTLKVQYFRRALRGEAAVLVAHLDPVASNYRLHLKTLNDAYKVGQEEVNNIIGKLNSINSWQKCQSSRDLFRLLTHVRTHYYLLNQVQQDTTSGDVFIVRAVMGLLPDRLGYDIIKKVPVAERTVDRVLELIQKDIDSCKEGESYGMGRGRVSRQPSGGPSHQRSGRKAMQVQRSSSGCLFCGSSEHVAHGCTTRSVEECWSILRKGWRCFNCLSDAHGASECPEPPQCDCGGGKAHSPSLCKFRSAPGGAGGPTYGKGRGRGRGRGFGRGRGDSRDKVDGQNTTDSVAEGGPLTLSADAQVFQPTSRGRGRGRGRAYFCRGAWEPIFLQTAHVELKNPVSGNIRKGRLVLDTACQDSYMLESTARDLVCTPVEFRDIHVEVFGTNRAVKHKSAVVKVEILDREGGAIPLELFTIDRLCGSISGHDIGSEASRQLQGYDLADPESVHHGDLPVHILVGLDQYWNIVNQKVCQSGFGPRLLDTRVGWVLSGAIAGSHSHQSRTRPSHSYFVSNPEPIEVQSEERLEDILHRFWDLDTVGVKEEEVSPVVAHFDKTVTFDRN